MPSLATNILLSLVTIWCVVLCWMDLRTRRLPNGWTLGGAAAALVLRYVLGGGRVCVDGVLGAAVCGALFVLFNGISRLARRGGEDAQPIGGGDIKMLFAAGAIAGLSQVSALLFYMSISGVIIGLVLLVGGRVDGRRLHHWTRSLLDWRYDRAAGRAGLPAASLETTRVPFSPAIAFGLLMALIG